MSSATIQNVQEQDRTLSDLLETYRHLQSDPNLEDARKREAAERMKNVWSKLAILQDPDGFINYVSDYVQREFNRRHKATEDNNIKRRGKPLCRCSRARHVCEAKQGLVPSKIRTQDLKYFNSPDSRTLAREYVQEHEGDVVIREAMESHRNLRAEIYAELSDIIAMMMGRDELEDGEGASADGHAVASEQRDPSATSDQKQSHAPEASADGGADPTAEELADAALAKAVQNADTEELAEQATDGLQDTVAVMNAVQNGEVSPERVSEVVEGDESVSELANELDGDAGDSAELKPAEPGEELNELATDPVDLGGDDGE